MLTHRTFPTVLCGIIALTGACSGSAGSPRLPEASTHTPPPKTATPAPVLSAVPYPAGAIGYAISWPQCGGPYPDEPFDFGIIGVNDGKAFTQNPCFEHEYRWAEGGRYHPSIYMNANYMEGANDFNEWWPCLNPVCDAYRYGWVAAHSAWSYADSFNAAAPVWWLDVQIVSDWSADLALNAHAVRGASDYLESSHGIRVGISSTAFQWQTIAGEAKHGRPVWDASAVDETQAALFCAAGKDFGGGRTEQIAYVAGGFEVVLACGATHRDRVDTP